MVVVVALFLLLLFAVAAGGGFGGGSGSGSAVMIVMIVIDPVLLARYKKPLLFTIVNTCVPHVCAHTSMLLAFY